MRPSLSLDRKRRTSAIGIMLMAVLALGLLAAGPIMASSGATVSDVPPTPANPLRTDCAVASRAAGHGAEAGHAPFKALDLKTIASAVATPEAGAHDMAGHAGTSSEPAAHDMGGQDEASQEPAAHDEMGDADASQEPAGHEEGDHTDASREPAGHEEGDHADTSHEPAGHEGAGHGDAPEQEAAAHGHGTEAQPIPEATRTLVLGSFGAANGVVIAVAAVLKRRTSTAARLRRDGVQATLPAGEAQ